VPARLPPAYLYAGICLRKHKRLDEENSAARLATPKFELAKYHGHRVHGASTNAPLADGLHRRRRTRRP
jgi:hypothetical protein